MMQKLKDMHKRFKEKTKDMTLKEKLVDYIWEYYRLPIVVSLFVILFLASYINSNFINPPNASFCSLTFYDHFLSDDVLIKMTSELNDALVPPDSKQEVYHYTFDMDPDNPEIMSMQVQRFAAMIQAKELDILFVDKENLNDLAQNEYIMSLNSLFTPDELKDLDEWLLEGTDEKGVYYAIDIEKSNPDFFKDAGCSVKGLMLCVIINTPHPENATEIIKYILA